MVIASVILGILFIINGVVSFSAPANAFFGAMNTFAFTMLVIGVFGMLRFFKQRALVPELILSVLAVLISFRYLFRPGDMAPQGFLTELDLFALYIAAAWFLIKGCFNVSYAVRTRFMNPYWIIGFVNGLLSIVLGVYSFLYPGVGVMTIGTLIGMWEIQCGLDLLTLGSMSGFIMDRVEEAGDEIEALGKEASRDQMRQNLALASNASAQEPETEEVLSAEPVEPGSAEEILAEAADHADRAEDIIDESEAAADAEDGFMSEAASLADEVAAEASMPADVIIEDDEDTDKDR